MQVNVEELKRLAEAALWTGRWYNGGCETLMGTYGDNSEFCESHGEIAYPFPLGIVPYLVEAQPAAILELIRQRDELLAALREIAEWTERYTTPGHPISTAARAVIAKVEG